MLFLEFHILRRNLEAQQPLSGEALRRWRQRGPSSKSGMFWTGRSLFDGCLPRASNQWRPADWAAGGDVQGANTRDQIIPCVESAHLCCKNGEGWTTPYQLTRRARLALPAQQQHELEMSTKKLNVEPSQAVASSLSVRCLPHFHRIPISAQIPVVPLTQCTIFPAPSLSRVQVPFPEL